MNYDRELSLHILKLENHPIIDYFLSINSPDYQLFKSNNTHYITFTDEVFYALLAYTNDFEELSRWILVLTQYRFKQRSNPIPQFI